MNIREPAVHVTYYYLREAPGDTLSRRRDRHDAFITETQRLLQLVSGWLSRPIPTMPPIPFWENSAPASIQSVMETGELQGRINASAWLYASVLRNMFLLRVLVSRSGEHDPTTWNMLDEALGSAPTTPSWLHMTRYWCGLAPRPPEEFEAERFPAIKTQFGVLSLGYAGTPHLLVYPDARTESRARSFIGSLSAQLDWYPVQAHYLLDNYLNRTARSQQSALEQVAQSVQNWGGSDGGRLQSLIPLQTQLETVEHTYQGALADLSFTESTAHEVHSLMNEYRLSLMSSGLWDAAPSLWELQVAALTGIESQIRADVQYVESTMRQMDLLVRGLQVRVGMIQGERLRLLIYLAVVIGLGVLTVLIADTSPQRIMARVIGLLLVIALAWVGWLALYRKRKAS